MHRNGISLMAALALGFALVGTARAQSGDTNSDTKELQKLQEELKTDIAELKAEIAALKAEFKGLRTAMTQAVAAMKTAGKTGAPQQRQRPAMGMVGKKAPVFEVTTIDGEKHTIGGKKDKPQVVFCYASWCGFCKKALPWIEGMYEKYKDKGVEVLLVNLDARGEGQRGAKTEQETLDTYKSMNLTMPMTMTTATNDTKKIGTAYKAQSFPTLFVLGPSGDVEACHIGAKQGLADSIAKELDLLMAGKTRADFPK